MVGSLDVRRVEVRILQDQVAEDADLLAAKSLTWVCQQPVSLAEDQLQVQEAKVFEQLEGNHTEDKAHLWVAHYHLEGVAAPLWSAAPKVIPSLAKHSCRR